MEKLKEYYTVQEIAEAVKLTDDAIRRYIYNGKLKAEKFNRTYIIDRASAEEFIKSRKG